MIGADELAGAPRGALDKPHRAVTTDIVEGAHDAVVAAHHDDALAEIFDRAPVARFGEFAGVAHDLPGGAEDAVELDTTGLGLEEVVGRVVAMARERGLA